MTYQPQQRPVAVRILTPLGHFTGVMRVPERAYLADWLTHAPPFIVLSDVVVESTGARLAHFSIHRDAIHLLVPSDAEARLDEPPSDARPHRVLVATDRCSLEGTVSMLPGTRVSDTFAHRRGFFVIARATVLASASEPASAPIAHALVNADRLIGVADLDDGPHA